jgi:hypothetical protein
MGLETIGDGLKTRIQTISNLKKRTYAPKELPGAVSNFPCAIILPGETLYGQTMGAIQCLRFRIIILLDDITKPQSANTLLDYVNPSGAFSVYNAIKGDPTLNSSCNASRVVRNLGLGTTAYGGGVYLSTEFEVECYG